MNRSLSSALLVLVLLPGVASCQGSASSLEPLAADAKVVAKPADPALAQIVDVAGLPRVLLIGDSISIGYTLPVRALLKGRANLHRVPANCGDTARGIKQLDTWLGQGKWDLIHFNFGLHDLKFLNKAGKYVSPEEGTQVATLQQYEANLRLLLARLRTTGARLVFATTTPVPAGTVGRIEQGEAAYNEVALKVMREAGVEIDDLHACVVSQQAAIQQPRNVHFSPHGYEVLAEKVAASITAGLKSSSAVKASPAAPR